MVERRERHGFWGIKAQELPEEPPVDGRYYLWVNGELVPVRPLSRQEERRFRLQQLPVYSDEERGITMALPPDYRFPLNAQVGEVLFVRNSTNEE
ncbi:hypothetical protein HY387_00260 [Candidatus Daviesbacteria bacterium]|nr:hypothetical protein [Candidatus Daviesbacteria bacterium]